MLLLAIEIVTAALALCGIAYYLLSLVGAWCFLRRGPASIADFTPPVSTLKPLRGADPHAYECFRSHCLQQYPDYEIIFGVSDPQDPAIALVERLKGEFPQHAIQLVHCPHMLGPNIKVSNLVQMLPVARYDYLLVNDGDIRVPPDYLRRIMAPLHDAQVGLSTALYRGLPGRTVWSKLEALSITDFVGSVLIAHSFKPRFRYAFGSTLAMSRRALEAAGGFERLADYLADDHQLGENISAAGYRVILSDLVVETTLPDYNFRDFWAHQLRWARTVRDASPRGYFGMVLALGVEWALLALIISGGAGWAWGLVITAAVLRILAVLVAALPVSQDRSIWRRLWLVPLRIAQGTAVWAAAFLSNTVVWRGQGFRLRHGKLYRPPSDS